jgi:hypothetical protein
MNNKYVTIDGKMYRLQEVNNKTGYEKVENGSVYVTLQTGRVCEDKISMFHEDLYENATYTTSRTLAENNARADRLMRKLRRFSAMHRDTHIDYSNLEQGKYCITYLYKRNEIFVDYMASIRPAGVVVFDTREHAKTAVNEFYDELIWYFTEYQDTMRELYSDEEPIELTRKN